MTPLDENEARARLQGVAPGNHPDVASIIATGRRRNRRSTITATGGSRSRRHSRSSQPR